MLTKTSANGKSVSITRTGETAFLLFDFDIEGGTLKYEHMNTLKTKILPLVQGGGGVRVIGMASRTGGEALNQGISTTRASSALAYIKQLTKIPFKVAQMKGV